MKNLILVEGPDCSGKTTLAKYLARIFKAQYWHMTWTPNLAAGMYDYMLNAMDNIKWQLMNIPGAMIILDRHWPSEICYAPVLRPTSSVAPFWQFDRRFQELDSAYIFCTRDDVIEAHEEQKNLAHAYSTQQFEQIVSNYKAFCISMSIRESVIFYNLNEMPQHQVADMIVEMK